MGFSSPLSVAEIATIVSGTVRGDPSVILRRMVTLEHPAPDGLTFISETKLPATQRALHLAEEGGAFLVPLSLLAELKSPRPLIGVSNPHLAAALLLERSITPVRFCDGVSPQASVAPSASLGEGVTVGPFAVIGAEVQVGARTTIHPHVVLYPRVVIGAGSIIHAGAVIREGVSLGAGVVVQPGAVIGADGFGFVPDPSIKGLRTIPHVGGVTIGDRVEIGANSCIDRGMIESSTVGEQTRIDNLVQVGHNASIGNGVILCGQVGLAGSVTLAPGVVLGGGVGVADHCSIVSGVRVGARGGVTNDITTPGDYAGWPAQPAPKYRREQGALRLLPRLLKRLRGKAD